VNSKNDRLRIKYFSEDQVKKIHANAMGILESHGFMVEHRGSLEILRDGGAEVDFEKQVVKVKSDLVEKCMGSTLSRFVLGARDSSRGSTR
jgi:trimethylamine:corrinoid methyltransferase-like protein